MEDLSRSDYPAMLASLQPNAAVHAFTERVRRIARQNQEIADWLQERRRVEDAYVAGLRKLLLFKVPNGQSELGIFQGPWDKILQSADAIAASHQRYATNVEKDVEHALRNFQNRREMQNINTISSNLQAMAKELDEAQDRSDKLTRKGGKANSQKVDQAVARLEAAQQQWESQAPFIFESLQALDEQRLNHLRDVLTQLVTHEVDQAARTQASAEDVLNTLLEVQTEREVTNFVSKTTAGRPKLEKRTTSTRQGSVAGPPSLGGRTSSLAPPSVTGHREDDDGASEHSGFREKDQGESKLRSRIGTMLGRRRQSIHGGFGPLSPQKNLGSFTRNLNSSHGHRGVSPRASSNNLAESHNRLSSLSESPTRGQRQESANLAEEQPHEGTNGVTADEITPARAQQPTAGAMNGTAEDIFDVPPPAGPPPSQQNNQEPAKDSDGYTVPAPMNDPISQAQKEAAAEGGEDGDHAFNVKIQKEPVAEEDPDAKQAALSNVAKSLTQMGAPTRKTGTIRGRRDVRNTVYMPSLSASESIPEDTTAATATAASPSSPALPTMSSRPSAVSALVSESSMGGTSDTQSVRSGMSLGNQTQHKHPEMHATGLNTSIIEYVSASFEDGEVKSAKINGEIAFAYNPDPSSSNPEHMTIRINNFASLSAIGPNRIVVNNVSNSPDEFSLDLSHLTRPSPSFTYRLQTDSDSGSDPAALAPHCPLVIKPAWKPTGDKLGLVLQYRLNPASNLPRPVTLSNVFISATYEGARASGAQSKPPSVHLKDKHVVYWKLGDVTLTEDWGKILCRIVGEGGAEPRPGHVEARWEYNLVAPLSEEQQIAEGDEGKNDDAGAIVVGSGISISRLVESKGKERAVDEEVEDDDPFADGNARAVTPSPKVARTWAAVPTVRKLASGKYEAK